MKAGIYARVSSEKQDVDLSISAQLKALRDYAVKNGHDVVKEFVDEAESGKTSARPAFREMVAMARRPSKPLELILVWKYSRFARSREDSILFKTMLRKNGVKVISISEPFEDNPTGRLLEAMIESLDEFYSANLGEEVARGMRESASRGFYLSSYAPYGYRKVKVKDGSKDRPKLEPVPHQVHVVSRIFKDSLEGKGLKEIVKGLNGEGIPGPKGKGWIKTTVLKILKNESYTGTLVWGRTNKRKLSLIRVENAWPAIIDRDTFNSVQVLLKERSPAYFHPRRVASRYLLSGIARCGHCGKALIGQDAKGGKFSYYVCGTLLKRGSGSCPTRYLNTKKFDNIIIEKIGEHVLTQDNLVELLRLVNEEISATSVDQRERLDIILTEISDANRRLERLYDALETGKVALDNLSPRITQLRQRLQQLQSTRSELEGSLSDKRVELADMETVTGYVSDLRNLLEESPFPERRSFIKSFVKDVQVTGNQVLLTYTIPMQPHKTKGELIEVPLIGHYGGAEGTRTPDFLLAKEALSQLSYSPTARDYLGFFLCCSISSMEL